MVWVSGVVGSYEKARAVLQRVGHLTISDSSVWRRVEKWEGEVQGGGGGSTRAGPVEQIFHGAGQCTT
jgi:hypothetical protein